jgi:hypothetical protein
MLLLPTSVIMWACWANWVVISAHFSFNYLTGAWLVLYVVVNVGYFSAMRFADVVAVPTRCARGPLGLLHCIFMIT